MKIKIKVVDAYDKKEIYSIEENGKMELLGIAEMWLAIEFLKELEMSHKVRYVS